MGNKKSTKHEESMWAEAHAEARKKILQNVDNLNISEENLEYKLPAQLRNHHENAGLFFGVLKNEENSHYVGARQTFEGNVIVVGGNGSGKSSCIVKPTLYTWQGSQYVVDIKGEHSKLYEMLWNERLVDMPFIVIDPTDPEGPSYDVFTFLNNDGAANLVTNVEDIARAIIPTPQRVDNPFWHEAERAILAAALLFFYKKGLSFSQTISQILVLPLRDLCKQLWDHGDFEVKNLIGQVQLTPKETFASLELGLRSQLRLFATDSCISHLFRGEREGANCFSWEHLENHIIFLKIPEHRVDAWSRAITLLHVQLLHFLERRPEKLSVQGKRKSPILLLFDEFARFGKLDSITSALATLRSKQVNVCLFVQSVAQLDRIYGPEERRVIFDNCQYRAILRATDPDTQKYIAEMIGSHMVVHEGSTKSFDSYTEMAGCSLQKHSVREYIVQPHELATLEDIILLTPYGYYPVTKRCLDELQFVKIPDWLLNEMGVDIRRTAYAMRVNDPNDSLLSPPNARPRETVNNPGATMLTVEERYEASKLVLLQNKGDEELENIDKPTTLESDRNNYIASMVLQAFPEFKGLKQGKGAALARNLFPIEAFLTTLANNREVVKQIAQTADCGELFGVE